MGNMFAASDYAGGEIAWMIFGIVLTVLVCTFLIYAPNYDGSPNNRGDYVKVAVLLVLGVVATIGIIIDRAHNRGETLQAYADLKQQGFQRPNELSVSDHKAVFNRLDCPIPLRLEQQQSRYVVVLFKTEIPRTLTPGDFTQLANIGCST